MGESMAIKVMYIVRIVMCEAETTSGKVREGERVRERRRKRAREAFGQHPQRETFDLWLGSWSLLAHSWLIDARPTTLSSSHRLVGLLPLFPLQRHRTSMTQPNPTFTLESLGYLEKGRAEEKVGRALCIALRLQK